MRDLFAIEDSETNESVHWADLRILVVGMQGPHMSYYCLSGLACLQMHVEAKSSYSPTDIQKRKVVYMAKNLIHVFIFHTILSAKKK